MAQVDITRDNRSDQRIVADRETIKGSKSGPRTSAPSGPALSGEGLELLRSSHC